MSSFYFLFCFKQKTAYEVRISDWSSDVCSSDLQRAAPEMRCGGGVAGAAGEGEVHLVAGQRDRRVDPGERPRMPAYRHVDVVEAAGADHEALARPALLGGAPVEIGRASCRERVCKYV